MRHLQLIALGVRHDHLRLHALRLGEGKGRQGRFTNPIASMQPVLLSKDERRKGGDGGRLAESLLSAPVRPA